MYDKIKRGPLLAGDWPTGSVSGRLSVTPPEMQRFESRLHRKGQDPVVSVLVEADLSSIENRIMAQLSSKPVDAKD